MKCVPLLFVSAVAVLAVACEKHPLPGEPPVVETDHNRNETIAAGTGEEHAGGKSPAPGEPRDANAQPAAKSGDPSAVKPAEPPKFFPEPAK